MKNVFTRSRRARLTRVAVLIAGVVALHGTACKPTAAPLDASEGRPNILLVTFDTTRADHIGCYGDHSASTPTLDGLARRGVRYAHCYATAPITLPSHTSVLTGLYPYHHKVRDNGAGPLDPAIETLAEVLRAAGYHTGAAIGAQVLNSRYGLNQGFDHYDENIGDSRLSHLHFAERSAEAVTDAATAWLHSIDSAPFFLWVHYFDPHEPYAPPGADGSLDRFAAYDGEISYADRQLGRLLKTINEKDQTGGTRTLIVATADHGESLDEHGERTHGLFVYNVTLHVPLIVAFPRPGKAPVTIEAPVSLVDVYPSLLKWVGLDLPYEIDGTTLPLAPDDAAARAAATRPIYSETQIPYNTYGWSPLFSLIIGDQHYIDAPSPELFNLATDPKEATNLYHRSDADASPMARTLEEMLITQLDMPTLGNQKVGQSAAAIKQLRALGYVGTTISGSANLPSTAKDPLPDPKDYAQVHNDAIRAAMLLERDAFQESGDMLKKVFAADPNNRWGLSLLIDMLKKEKGFPIGAAIARDRMKQPLPSDFDVTLPAAIGFGAARAGAGSSCVAMLKNLVSRKPDEAELRCSLAAVLIQLGQTTKAKQQLDAALKIDKANTLALVGLGDLASMQGNLVEAARQYEAAIAAGDKTGATYAKLGLAYQNSQHLEKAIAAYRESVRLDPTMVESHLVLADLLAKTGHEQEAIDAYHEVLKQSPKAAGTHYNLGLAYAQQRKLPLAAEEFAKAIELDPTMGDAYINLAMAQIGSGQLDQAQKTLTHAEDIPAVAAVSRYLMGVVAAHRNDFDTTVALYEEAIKIKPSYFAPIDELSKYYLMTGREADAARVLEIGVKNIPDRVDLLVRLARLRATSSDDALRDGSRALKLAQEASAKAGRPRADVLAALAAAQAETGDFAAAVATCEEAKRVSAKNPAGHSKLKQLIDKQLAQFQAGKPYRAGQ